MEEEDHGETGHLTKIDQCFSIEQRPNYGPCNMVQNPDKCLLF